MWKQKLDERYQLYRNQGNVWLHHHLYARWRPEVSDLIYTPSKLSQFTLTNSLTLSRATKNYIEGLKSVNDFVYVDDENCLSLLHLAAGLDSEHREDIIELLIESRADVNRRGKSENVGGVRPLHLAAMWGYDLTVKLLLYHGADASLRDENNLSPVDYATISENYLCISLLLRYGRLNATAQAWSEIMNSSLK